MIIPILSLSVLVLILFGLGFSYDLASAVCLNSTFILIVFSDLFCHLSVATIFKTSPSEGSITNPGNSNLPFLTSTCLPSIVKYT
jgi:hypothetical protein